MAADRESSPLVGFLAKNPAGGQHHVCFEVPDIHEAKAEMEECASEEDKAKIASLNARRLLRM